MIVNSSGSRERYRSFIFVINNYTQQDLNRISKFCNDFNPTWLIYGLEHAPTTGTPHVQGTFNFEIYFPQAPALSVARGSGARPRFWPAWAYLRPP